MADNFKFAQLQPFSLAGAGAIAGATTIILKSFNKIDGTALAMTDFGTIGFGTIQPGEGTSEEQISFTGVTQNTNGTATLTGVSTVLFTAPYTKTSGLAKTHAGSTIFIISNTSGFYDELVSKDDDETVNGIWTFTQSPIVPDPTAALQAANKEYVDNIAIAGAPDSSTTVKGIGRVSVAPVTPTIPIFVGDNDPRVPTQGENDALVGTSGVPSTINPYVTNADTSTTATVSSVVRRLAGGNITVITESQANNSTNAASTAYVDAGLAAKIPIGYQQIPYFTNANGSYGLLRSTSETDGSVMYTVSASATGNLLTITRWLKDTNTGVYFQTHQTTLALANSATNFSIVVIGSFVYVISFDSGSIRLVTRYASADLTSPTTMTLSGTTYANGNAAFSDGTFLYIYESSGVFRKYSISGTTYTNVTTITYTSAGNIGVGGAICDGTSVWMCDTSAATFTLLKYPIAGGASSTSLTKTIPNPYPNPTNQLVFIFVKTGIIGILQTWIATNATVNVGTIINLFPITQP